MGYKKFFYLNCFIVIIIAFNLRAPITGIGPMIDVIKEAYGLSSTLAGVLTSLALIASGSISFVVGYFSPIRAIVLGIFLIFISEILRSFTGVYGLFLGMFGIGCGIAINNVLLPSFIKEKFPKHIPIMMGIYSLVLNISSIAGVVLVLPLLHYFNLAGAMAFWAIFSFMALVIYYPQAKNGRFFRTKKKSSHTVNLLKHATTWKITLFMGFQSFLAYSLFFWYVEIIVEKGLEKAFAMDTIFLGQLIAAPMSLLAPLLLAKLRKSLHTLYIASLCFMYVITFVMLLLLESKMAILLCVLIMGFPWGGSFSIALLFIAQKSPNTQIAAKLSALTQGFGYLIAALGQQLVGVMHDQFGNFASSIVIFIFVAILLNFFGYLSYKSHIIK